MKPPPMMHPLILAERLLEHASASPTAAGTRPEDQADRALRAALELHRLARRPIVIDGEEVTELVIGADGRFWATLHTGVATTVGPADGIDAITEAVRVVLTRSRAQAIGRVPTPAPRAVTEPDADADESEPSPA